MAIAISTLALIAPAHTETTSARCSNRTPIPCIAKAARRYHQSVADAERVAYCESSDDPAADNGNGDLGLFQILYPSTWEANGNPWRHHSPFSARYSALTAMRMWSRGERGQWECQ